MFVCLFFSGKIKIQDILACSFLDDLLEVGCVFLAVAKEVPKIRQLEAMEMIHHRYIGVNWHIATSGKFELVSL